MVVTNAAMIAATALPSFLAGKRASASSAPSRCFLASPNYSGF